jgi:hypothetical protein
MYFVMFSCVFAVLGSAAVFVWAVIFSRFFFDRYLKRQHPIIWKRLRAGPGLHYLGTDANAEMAKFGARIDEDLGDPRLRKMKVISRRLYRFAVALWLLGVVSLVALKMYW